MKILEVTGFPNNGSGSGTLMSNQTEAFIKEGHQVHTILSENRTDFPRVENSGYRLVAFTAQSENPEIIEGQLPFNFPMFTTHTRSTETFKKLKLEQIKAIEEKYKEAIDAEIKEFAPDVIHAQHNWLHAAVCTYSSVPVVTTIHGTDLMGYEFAKGELKEIEEKLKTTSNQEEIEALTALKEKDLYLCQKAEDAARFAKRIIVISKDQNEKFCTLFPFAKDKVVFIKNGYNTDQYFVRNDVDKEEFFAGFESALAPDKKVPTDFDKLVVFVGKFAEFKGIDVLLDANKIYQDAIPGKKVMTVIVGAGALDAELKAQATRLNLTNTHFVGLQTPETICKLHSFAQVSLIPSRREPFGLVVIEGAACGHPVIATNSGGIPDILNTTGKEIKEFYNPETDSKDESILKPDEGTTGTYTTDVGILVPVDDSVSLANAVIDVLTEKKTFDIDFITNYMQKNYSQSMINKMIEDLFQQAIDEGKKA